MKSRSIVAGLVLGLASMKPVQAVEPATIAATLGTLGKISGALGSGPDRAAGYAMETFRAIGGIDNRLEGVEETLAFMVRDLADSGRIRAEVRDTLDARSAKVVAGAFERLNTRLSDGRLQETERSLTISELAIVNSELDQARDGEPMIVAAALTLEPFLRIAALEAARRPSEVSQAQLDRELDGHRRHLKGLIDPMRQNSIPVRMAEIYQGTEASKASLHPPVRSALEAILADLYSQGTSLKEKSADFSVEHTPVLSGSREVEVWSRQVTKVIRVSRISDIPCIVKRNAPVHLGIEDTGDNKCGPTRVYSNKTVFDYNQCGYATVNVSHLPATGVATYALSGERSSRCANQSSSYSSYSKGSWKAGSVRRHFRLMSADSEAISILSHLEDNVRAALAAIDNMDTEAMVEDLLAQAQSTRAVDLVFEMRTYRRLASAGEYIDLMERARDEMQKDLASARERLETMEQDARQADRWNEISSLFNTASTALNVAMEIDAWLEETGFFDEPDNQDALEEVSRPAALEITPQKEVSPEDMLAIQYAAFTNPRSLMEYAERHLVQLSRAEIGTSPGRADFIAVAVAQALSGGSGDRVSQSFRASQSTASDAAAIVWSKVPSFLRDLATAIAPTSVGTAEPYDEQHRRLIISRMIAEVGRREAERGQSILDL